MLRAHAPNVAEVIKRIAYEYARTTRMRRNDELPRKDCASCGRPFAWRRKWAQVWDELRFCSDRCRGAARKTRPIPAPDAD